MQVKKQQLEPDMEQQIGSNWKRSISGKGCISLPCLFKLYAEYIMWYVRLEEAQSGIKILWRNISNLTYADDTTLMAEREEGALESIDVSERGE